MNDIFVRMVEPCRRRGAALQEMRRQKPGEFWFGCLFWAFWLSLASFPVGYGMREVMPLVCLCFLIPYYRYEWKNSVWRRLSLRPLFYCLWLMIAIGIVCSQNILDSLWHAGTGINKGFILPIIGMECVRGEKDLRRLVWACAFACFWQGLDGVWQALTGHDFIMGYAPNAGRLTGSLGDYTVGNYIALALIPSFALWHILRRRLDALSTAFLVFAVLLPAFFLLQGASARSGILAVAASLFLWAFLRREHVSWRLLLWPLPVFAFFACWQPQRMSWQAFIGDGRWSLWELGWRVFLEHPWFGAGAGQYNTAFRALGLAPEKDVITISHPHNLYLDMLYAHGLAGFCLGMAFLLGFAWWGYRRIRPGVQAEISRPAGGIHWRLAGWFWLGFIGWLINGIFGHDFYRIWYLALAMSHLGVMIGAVVNGPCLSAKEMDGELAEGGPQPNPPSSPQAAAHRPDAPAAE
ncbi:MAG: O-antigen ligase family protein [Desulfovibrionaceae bacterium]|nr:O-antigen ligase family protein [Desulfovibrionaceae bacterium]